MRDDYEIGRKWKPGHRARSDAAGNFEEVNGPAYITEEFRQTSDLQRSIAVELGIGLVCAFGMLALVVLLNLSAAREFLAWVCK